MPVDRDALKLPFESAPTEEGLHARFHEDGQLAYLGLYRDGQVQMEVEVNPVLATGVSRRSLNFEFQAELPKGLQDQLEDWTRAKVAEIEDASGGALHCDFCRRHADEVARLIEGPNLYICNECVHLCVAIMSQEPED